MYREHYTRKISRIKINEDLMNMLIVSSDPLISSMRKAYSKKIQSLSEDAKFLLKIPEENESNLDKSESENDSCSINFESDSE